ncbi:MAG: 30S ribosomal protein S16 [Alphaproteobacteria bacterium]|nr:MAG: 30S ribosomal protein S16 [Alphaproteobacteria bacterium]
MLKLRFARGGRKKNPVFSLVIADSRSPRDGKFVEKIGTYSPCIQDNEKRFVFKKDRAEYWLKQGVQMTDRASRLLSINGVDISKK